MAIMSEKTPRFPIKQALAVSGLFFIGQFVMRVAKPFLLFMVHDFFPELPTTAIGYRIGYLTSAYFLGQVGGSIMWGRLADRFGRRPAAFVSVIGVLLSCLLFGFSLSYAWALFSRALLGFINGTAVISKAILSEILDGQQKARGFSLLGIMANSAELTAPVIGGFLSCPAARFPVLDIPFFVKFAYCIPCLIAVALGVIIVIGVYKILKETSTYTVKSENTTTGTSINNIADCSVNEMLNEIKNESDAEESADVSEKSCLAGSQKKQEKGSENLPIKEKNVWSLVFNRQVVLRSSMYGWISFMQLNFQQCITLLLVLSPEKGGLMFSSSDLGILMILNGVFSVMYQVTLFPYVTNKFGVVRSFQVFLVISAVFSSVIPFISNMDQTNPYDSLECRDNITCFNNTLSNHTQIDNLHVNVTDSMDTDPYQSVGQCEFNNKKEEGYDGHISLKIWVILVLVTSVVALSSSSIVLNVVILIQNSAEPSTLGTIHGVSHTLAAIGRCVGPSVGANLFAWSQENGLPWPLDYHLMFHVMSLSCLGILLLSTCLSKDHKTSSKKESYETVSFSCPDESVHVQRVTAV